MAVNDSRSDAVVHGARQNHCRRRRSEHDSSSNLSLISDLEDDLLMEILQRLPTAKDAFLCSSVCKHWYGIIFSPYFIKRFITYHANHVARKNGSSDCLCGFEKSISMVMMSRVYEHKAIILPHPTGQFQSFNLKSFCEGSCWTLILSSCHDLLFCVSLMRWYWEFYICNPLTMQVIYISVPEWEGNYTGFPFAFVCEPYCSRDSQGGCILSARLRYRVLRIRTDKLSDAKCLPIEIYCSEGGELTKDGFIEDSLFGEEFQKGICSNVVVYNGKVHWCNGKSIVAYDPFRVAVDVLEEDSSRQNGFIIKCPEYANSLSTRYELGVCRGRLRLMHYEFIDDLSTSTLSVWDLEDYEKGKWSVVRQFCLDSVVYDGHPLFERLAQWLKDDPYFDVAVDPCNENVVYLGFDDGNVALWNLERKELHMVAEFPVDEPLPVRFFCGNKTFCKPIVLPWWPTPISALKRGT